MFHSWSLAQERAYETMSIICSQSWILICGQRAKQAPFEGMSVFDNMQSFNAGIGLGEPDLDAGNRKAAPDEKSGGVRVL